MNATKKTYIELLQKALAAFQKIDLEEYEIVTGDDESSSRVAGTLKRMIANVEQTDDEAWDRTVHADRGE